MNSLAVQWLQLSAFTAGGRGLIPGWGTKILQATWHDRKKKGGGKREREELPNLIKGIYQEKKKSTANIILNKERLNAFPGNSGTEQYVC